MPSVTDAILESSGCAHTVRAGVPAAARDKDTRALASGLAKRWGQVTSPLKASAAGANGQANGSGVALSTAAYVPTAPRSAEVIAAEQAAEEVSTDGFTTILWPLTNALEVDPGPIANSKTIAIKPSAVTS